METKNRIFYYLFNIHEFKVLGVGVGGRRQKGRVMSCQTWDSSQTQKRPLFLTVPCLLSSQLLAVSKMNPPWSSKLRTTFYNTITVSQAPGRFHVERG